MVRAYSSSSKRFIRGKCQLHVRRLRQNFCSPRIVNVTRDIVPVCVVRVCIPACVPFGSEHQNGGGVLCPVRNYVQTSFLNRPHHIDASAAATATSISRDVARKGGQGSARWQENRCQRRLASSTTTSGTCTAPLSEPGRTRWGLKDRQQQQQEHLRFLSMHTRRGTFLRARVDSVAAAEDCLRARCR